MLGERFRIVALLGRGGMGEVYRAEDLRLGQTVALKLLPEDVENDPVRLRRLLDEVRMALRITHPNVCRVHDVGEVQGRHYVTMEYVEGGDLGSLLRRVGRLPEDRAVEVARQLCAGLAAVHAQGVLHRDLKPSNVLLDDRGRVKITDFGLASLATGESTRGGGTPAYMAPEQWDGTATLQSDIYALGMVLYEMFTGHPVFSGKNAAEWAQMHRESVPTSPTSHVDTLDPAVERILLLCLEKDPMRRPASALAVAAALPGGDPLAAALAAGETPSPELVARARAEGGLRPAVAGWLLASIAAGFALIVALGASSQLTRIVPLPKSPAVLAERAQDILKRFVQTPAVDRNYCFGVRTQDVTHLRETAKPHELVAALRTAHPAVLEFLYRTAPRPLTATNGGGLGDWMRDPPVVDPGMTMLALDPNGKLLRFVAVPVGFDSTGSATAAVDWAPMFADAGLDLTRFEAIEPEWTPPVYAASRFAWRGALPDAPQTEVRVEAAAFGGRPVAFAVLMPWEKPRPTTDPPAGFWKRTKGAVGASWYLIVLVGAAIMAWRNVRLGRGDRRGALRFALYLGAVRFLWFLDAHHVSSGELSLLVSHIAWSCSRICTVWLFYLAFEPYARRIWPHMMVSWVRLLSGRWRDPLVGRHAVLGFAFGVGLAILAHAIPWLTMQLGLPASGYGAEIWELESLRGLRAALVSVIGVHTFSTLTAFQNVTMLLVLRLLTRSTKLALALCFSLAMLTVDLGTGSVPLNIAAFVIFILSLFYVLLRLGFLSVLVAVTTLSILTSLPLTFDASSWFFGVTVIVLGGGAVLLTLAVRAALADALGVSALAGTTRTGSRQRAAADGD